VGRFPANAWGLHDVHGNVWEWCADWYAAYPQGDVKEPQGANSGDARVLRGGSWVENPGRARAAFRCRGVPSFRSAFISCRVLLCLD
jgi:formylglycine-generating enzyme